MAIRWAVLISLATVAACQETTVVVVACDLAGQTADLGSEPVDSAMPADLTTQPDDLSPLPSDDLSPPADLAVPPDLTPPPPDFAGSQLGFYFVPTIGAGLPYGIAVEVLPPRAVAVTLSVVSGPGPIAGTISGTTDANGFLSLHPHFDRAGTYVISATSPDAASATTTFRVAGVPTWTVQPTNTSGGTAISPAPTVTLVDATGAIDTTDGDSVSLGMAFDSSCPGVGGNMLTVQGVATFTNLVPFRACAGYRLNASTSWAAAESDWFDVTVGPPAALQIVVVGTPLVNSPFTVRVEVVDAGLNVVQVPATPISVSLTGATLGGTTTRATVGSVATFANLTVDHAGSWTLDAAGGGWTGTTPFRVTAWEVRAKELSYFNDLTVDPTNPDVVYLFANGLVEQSTDAGASFASMGVLPFSHYYSPLLADPLTPQRLYVAGESGLMRSDNSGVSFYSIGAGLPSPLGGASLSADPLTGDIFVLTGGMVYRSDDGGATFNAITPAVANVRSVAIDPSTSALWLGADGAVSMSTDSGVTWTNKSGNLPSNCSIMKLIVSPVASATVLAECLVPGTPSSALVTVDGGASWTSVPGVPAQGIVVDAGGTWYSPFPLSSQLWKSDDGANWRTVGLFDPVQAVASMPGRPGWLYGYDFNNAPHVLRTKTGGE